MAITNAIKYAVKINEIKFPAFKSCLIVGNASEIIDDSIADINIINIKAITVMIDFNRMKYLLLYIYL
ncbi:Uncharacterised protein [Staphylococcus aureus]|nr:Uncharacterised protein [Staphylococcus aureus]